MFDEEREEELVQSNGVLKGITYELREHAPFTFFGAISGVAVALIFLYTPIPHKISHVLFATFHPGHVFLSAVVTTAMFRLHGKRGILATLLVGYIGSVGIGTLSDSLIPYLSERLLELHDPAVQAEMHLGFIEEWYLVNPLALLGIAVGSWRPGTKIPHAGHVLLSTWASLFHMLMAIGHEGQASTVTIVLIPVVLFVAVWAPCCTGDIIFPLIFTKTRRRPAVRTGTKL